MNPPRHPLPGIREGNGDHEHDPTHLVVHRLTWERHPRESIEDAIVVCVACLATYGLTCELVHYPFDELEELPPEDLWEISEWVEDDYPFHPAARPGDVCYRPGPDYPPSMREIWFRRGEESLA